MGDAQRAESDRDTEQLFGALPVRTGHYRLESGYHTDTWLDLGTLFVDPVKIAPAVTMLAGRLRRYGCDAVGGPMSGGALLAQALAGALRTCFFYTEHAGGSGTAGLFTPENRPPPGMARGGAGARLPGGGGGVRGGSAGGAPQPP